MFDKELGRAFGDALGFAALLKVVIEDGTNNEAATLICADISM